MLVLDEVIGDPVVFFKENPELCRDLRPQDTFVVVAPDIEARIRRHSITSDIAESASRAEVSPILGGLYMTGSAKGVRIGGGVKLAIDWFDSVDRTNALLEEFGRTPGVNALKATNGAIEKYSVQAYVGHLAAGELIQSCGDINFLHDRERVHKFTSMVISAEASVALIDSAQAAAAKRYRRTAAIKQVAGAFESGTNGISLIMHELHLTGGVLDLKNNEILQRAYRHAGNFLRVIGIKLEPGETVASYLTAQLDATLIKVAEVRANRAEALLS